VGAVGRSSEAPTLLLRSTGWDGPTPQVGDVLLDPDGNAARIVHVAEGAGAGQWRLEVVRCSLFRWSARFDD
jgi:hypothetical protein